MSQQPAPLAISIIIPVRNGGPAFRECLASLACTVPPPAELIVVHDGEPAQPDELPSHLDARELSLPVRSGPGRARNLGAQSAHGDILFFIDADVTVPPDALAQVAAAFARDPGLAALIGSYDDAPATPGFLSQYRNLAHHYVHQTASEESSTFWGACGAVRRDAFLALGGFDERYREPSIEDIELGYRLRQAGHRIRLCKDLQVKHLKAWTLRSILRTDLFCRAVPWTQLILRHPKLADDRKNLRFSSRISVLLTGTLLLSLLAASFWPNSLFLSAFFAVSLLLINAPLYAFFWRKRGAAFALRAIPMHWLYYFCGGLGFVVGVLRHVARRIASCPGNVTTKDSKEEKHGSTQSSRATEAQREQEL